MAEIMKGTYHNGKVETTPEHNGRDFPKENSAHIDPEKTKENVYWDCYEEYYSDSEKAEKMKFSEVEKEFYEENYREALAKQNHRYIKDGHPERCKDIKHLMTSKNTMPEETILQIGSVKTGTVSPKELFECWDDFRKELEKYNSNVHILDMALHLDETSPHIHFRKVYDYDTPDGKKISQEKALQALGFQLPNPEKKKGRYNNRKMSFDNEIRKTWYRIIKEHGIEIDEKPISPSRKHKETTAFQLEQDEKKLRATNDKIDRLYRDNDAFPVKKQILGKEEYVQVPKQEFDLMRNTYEKAKYEVDRAERLENDYRDICKYNRQLQEKIDKQSKTIDVIERERNNAVDNCLQLEDALRKEKKKKQLSPKEKNYMKENMIARGGANIALKAMSEIKKAMDHQFDDLER